LILTIRGTIGQAGADVRMMDEGGEGVIFRLIATGNPLTETRFHGLLAFNDKLFLGGGSGRWMSGDAILYQLDLRN